ncbi:MAG: DUF368 domain-containing protein [Acidimicrobiales bacterium]|nr:DUF368 domain-containing protein [Acidimicrobiales bacterium]
MIKTAGLQLIRGFVMGAADVVPGVSGGTVALVLGIYERWIGAIKDGAHALGRLVKGDVSGFIERMKAIDWAFLIPLIAGVGIAFAGLAGPIETALKDYPEEMAGLFLGLIVASIWIAWKLVGRKDPARIAITVGVGIALFYLLGFSSAPAADPSKLAFFGAGAVAICAMVLPGISGSFILLMLGMYAAVLGVVHDRAVDDIAVFGVGAVLGLSLFSSVLSWLLEHHRDTVMAALVGLMLGSIRVLWPWPNGVGIISDDAEEAVVGTGLDWPSGSEFWWPTVLAVGAALVVIVFSAFAERYAATPEPVPLGATADTNADANDRGAR